MFHLFQFSLCCLVEHCLELLSSQLPLLWSWNSNLSPHERIFFVKPKPICCISPFASEVSSKHVTNVVKLFTTHVCRSIHRQRLGNGLMHRKLSVWLDCHKQWDHKSKYSTSGCLGPYLHGCFWKEGNHVDQSACCSNNYNVF